MQPITIAARTDDTMRSYYPMPINIKYRNGRRVMLAAVIMFALVHLCGFLPTSEPRNLPMNWTSISTYVPAIAWAIVWGCVIPIAVTELIRGKGRIAISLTVGLMCATSAAYLISYIITITEVGWGSREWFYFGLYAFMAGIIHGLLTKVGALKVEPPEETDDAHG